MSEEVWCVEGEAPLYGIFSEPERVTVHPTVVMLSAGMLHRVGPHRLYVRFGRELARSNWCSLRFDFTGIGDGRSRIQSSVRQLKPVVQPGVSLSPQAQEIARAMSELQRRRGLDSFVLFAMCLSVNPALEVAWADDRVKGLILVNGAVMPRERRMSIDRQLAASTAWRYYRNKLIEPRNWKRLLSGKSNYREVLRTLQAKLFEKSQIHSARREQREFWARVARRALPIHLIYSEGSPNWDAFEQVHAPILKSMEHSKFLSLTVIPGVDHTFTPIWSQDRLMRVSASWLLSTFGGASGPA